MTPDQLLVLWAQYSITNFMEIVNMQRAWLKAIGL